MQPKILVAGIGNIFLGDDAFVSEVARQLAVRNLPDEVQVIDFGIRGLDLAYALLEPRDVTILVDASPRGGEPGTVYTIEPDLRPLLEGDSRQPLIEPHGMNPMKVLEMVRGMGGEFKRILLVGCEPETLGGEEGFMGLSAPVQAAVGKAVQVVEMLVANILAEDDSGAIKAQHVAAD